MRNYSFSHFMLSTMAKGIQAKHSTIEMFVKYKEAYSYQESSNETEKEISKANMLYEWATNHKTDIILNGGVTPDLEELKTFLENEENPYPWSSFYEDESLGRLMTSISIVLPEKIYLMKDYMNKYKSISFTDENELLILDISEYKEIETEDLEKINSFDKFNKFEIDLIEKLGNYRLAS